MCIVQYSTYIFKRDSMKFPWSANIITPSFLIPLPKRESTCLSASFAITLESRALRSENIAVTGGRCGYCGLRSSHNIGRVLRFVDRLASFPWTTTLAIRCYRRRWRYSSIIGERDEVIFLLESITMAHFTSREGPAVAWEKQKKRTVWLPSQYDSPSLLAFLWTIRFDSIRFQEHSKSRIKIRRDNKIRFGIEFRPSIINRLCSNAVYQIIVTIE